jgi:hypothetical protein
LSRERISDLTNSFLLVMKLAFADLDTKERRSTEVLFGDCARCYRLTVSRFSDAASVERLETSDNRSPLGLQEWRQDHLLSQCRDVLVDSEAGAVGRNLEKHVPGLTEIQ